jgi:hypothetical protein
MTVSDLLNSFLNNEHLLFLRDWLGSDLQVIHIFSFRCPLVNTPQLNTQLLNSLTAELWLFYVCRVIELSWTELTSGEPNVSHHVLQFLCYSVCIRC